MNKNSKIFKKILKNGLTVLVKPSSHIPKVSVQLWYNVGSKDEKSGQKGIAHLIEHMIFKGTKELSESDINLITHKLSGYCNAFTSYDYTGYLFDFPSHHWQEALPIMADCMKNCTFKEELLNSELKAVIQELKMYNDDFNRTLAKDLISTMFLGHPYQHPIIGYKHDLWSLDRKNLIEFYKEHYTPNNATLVVVGDVDVNDVFKLAEENFGQIESNPNYIKQEYNVIKDLSSKSVTLYRDITQSSVILAYMIPGAKQNKDYEINIISYLLAKGRWSRLYKKLVNELHLVTSIDAFNYSLFDQDVFFVQFIPKDSKDIDQILELINAEIQELAQHGPTDNELQRATKTLESSYLSTLESSQEQAYIIGMGYLATGNENYIYDYLDGNNSRLSNNIKDILNKHFHKSQMNVGQILPMSEKDRELWLDLQKLSDEEDARVLGNKNREIEVELGVKVNNIDIKQPKKFNFPKPDIIVLESGLEVLVYNNKNLPKIDLIIELKSNHHYDPDHLAGINYFVSKMLREGTKNYNAHQLAYELESQGIKLSISPGFISMSLLKDDLKKSLELLKEIVNESVFDEKSVEKVRHQIISEIKEYWDEPAAFSTQIVREHIYPNHHYKKNILGTVESVANITREELLEYYKKYISSSGARMALVGDIGDNDLKELLEQTIGKWKGANVEELIFNPISQINNREINHYINRDQVVLCFAGLSVSRKDPDYDKLLLFDQIFCGGVLGSMSSKLFQLRERSGLFYTISGSLLRNSEKQPGMIVIKTIVSNDRLPEAEKLIEAAIDNACSNIIESDFEQAKNALTNSCIDNFASNQQIASSFLFLRRYGFDNDFFDTRAQELSKISIKDVQDTVSRVLHTDKLIKFRIGRVSG